LVEGWSKNVYLGGRRSFPNQPVLQALVPVMLALAVGFWLVPPVALALSAGTAPWAAAATVAAVMFWMLISYGMRIPVWYGLLYPLGAAVVLYIVARSTWRGRRKVEWRGRVYAERDDGLTSG
ncbi:MAG TPA: hypothetical protein VEB59_17235, partial [Gemmatimonadales bacterium]|nr:hypothetical protein [Gemmatimonadales bacterium]